MRITFLLFFVVGSMAATGQKKKKEDNQLATNLQVHISFLASDKLEGRRTGTQGEKDAADYIVAQFKSIGLTPKGTSGFLQPFEISEGMQVNGGTYLIINEDNLQVTKDFFPLSISSNASLEAMPSIALQESGMPWFWDIKEILEENVGNPHFDLETAVQNKAGAVKEKGATALVLYNTSAIADKLAFHGRNGVKPAGIPVIYITKKAADKYLVDATASLEVKLKTDVGAKVRNGMNVVGYIDNGAAHTIILGAHFDHLGRGEDNNTMQRSGEAQIHNGADDNASGVAAMLELARLLKASSKAANNNYLFIAFSGEELGLYGSKYFTNHPVIDLSTVNYMMNMDMIGRLNDSSKTVTVGGYGTSPAWGLAYGLKGKSALYTNGLQFRFDSSGTGPSDHTSFYQKNIPVLFYFTGLHSDYHRPTDDVEKINYAGEALIVNHLLSVIEHTNNGGKLSFAKTRETQSVTSARFSVTLGIMPDYTFAGSGVKVDGVSEGRPAQKGGIQTGDVITAIGVYKTESIESYMQALGKYKRGDTVRIYYQRNGQPLEANITF